MKKLLFTILSVALFPLVCMASGGLIDGDNPPGSVSVSSTSIPSGSTNYIQNTSTLQSGAVFFVSSGTANNFIASTGTFSNMSISSMTSTLPMSARKITGLANGSSATDAAAYGQIGMYSVLCSSVVAISSSSAVAPFVPSNLGCSATLSNSSHHIYITANGSLEGSGSVSGNVYSAAVFVDGVNMDAAIYGQCALTATVTGLSAVETDCSFLEYYLPGDTSSHAYRIYFSAASAPGGGTATFGGQGTTARFVVFEVQ